MKGLVMPSERPTDHTAEPQAAPADTRNITPPGEQPTLNDRSPGEAMLPELADHPRYAIEACIGRGGMGAVYRARHRVMERQVALKVVRADLAGTTLAFDRFSREVKAAAALSHPNIVAAFDAEQAGSFHFLVMEYVDGSDLAKVVAERGPLPVAQACHYMFQAALGLQHAFEKGMIHRDLKPQNLMLLRQTPPGEQARYPYGQIKILDFGLARFAHSGSAETASGVLLGTVDFMAPEQANDARSADIRSDIYSLGCTLYYLLSARAMFPDGTLIQRVMAHVDKQPPPLTNFRKDLPPGLLNVLAKILAKDPGQRYQTPAELARALAPFTGCDSCIVPAPMPPQASLILDALPAKFADVPPTTAAKAATPRPRLKPAALPKPRRSRFLLGCFVLALVSILSLTGLGAYLIYLTVNRISDVASKQMSDMRVQAGQWQNLEVTFHAPAESAPDEELFPPNIDDYQRGPVDTNAAIPELGIDLKGRHAEYRNGDTRVQVYVYKATKLEKEAAYERAFKALQGEKKAKAGRFQLINGNAQSTKVTYHVDPLTGDQTKKQRGILWWGHDRMFVLRTPLDVDPEPLLLSYLVRLNELGMPKFPPPPPAPPKGKK